MSPAAGRLSPTVVTLSRQSALDGGIREDGDDASDQRTRGKEYGETCRRVYHGKWTEKPILGGLMTPLAHSRRRYHEMTL